MLSISRNDLQIAVKFLKDKLKASGIKNIHRMRLVKAMEKEVEKLGEEEMMLLKEYAVLNEDGELTRSEEGDIKLKNGNKFRSEQNKLFSEIVTFNEAVLEEPIRTVKDLVENFEEEVVGDDAEAHYIISTSFRIDEEE